MSKGTIRKKLNVDIGNVISTRVNDAYNFCKILEETGVFDANRFRLIRRRAGSQAMWSDMVGVSQGTIGNWERGITYPDSYYRRRILRAAKEMADRERDRALAVADSLGVKLRLDPVATQKTLNSSILNAALTDFDYDEVSGRIVPIPFASDDRMANVEAFQEDKENLLRSLSEQSELIAESISGGANLEADRLVKYFSKYRRSAKELKPNPRLLHRIGETIARRTASDDVRFAINDWDEEAIDGFNSDHRELMRLYFREALAKAQSVETLPLEDVADEQAPAENFYEAASLLENAANSSGQPVFDEDIPTLLRDIGNEVRDLEEAERFTADPDRALVFRRRKREAIKNGSIYIGRVLFFASLFVVMTPSAFGTLGSVASILGLMDVIAPGSIRSIYERLRKAFPLLPRLGDDEQKK